MSLFPPQGGQHRHWGKAAEKEWQQTLEKTLVMFRWTTMHVFPLRTEHGWRTGTSIKGAAPEEGGKGWPDLTAFRGEFVVAIEVKGYDARGRPTPFQPGQVPWLERFALIPSGRAWVLRPTDDFDAIVQWLRFPKDAPRRFGYEVAA